MIATITKKIYPPNTAGSGSHRWYVEVRKGGWLMCQGHFDSRKEAQKFIMKKCVMSKSVANEYQKMFERYNKK